MITGTNFAEPGDRVFGINNQMWVRITELISKEKFRGEVLSYRVGGLHWDIGEICVFYWEDFRGLAYRNE